MLSSALTLALGLALAVAAIVSGQVLLTALAIAVLVFGSFGLVDAISSRRSQEIRELLDRADRIANDH